MPYFSSLEKTSISHFLTAEHEMYPEWFSGGGAKNFSPTNDMVLYFSAFVGALTALESATRVGGKVLKNVDDILKKIRRIMKAWDALRDDQVGRTTAAKTLRLKLDEKILVVIYRAICADKGGASAAEIVKAIGGTEEDVVVHLQRMHALSLVAQGQRTGRWTLVT